MPRPDGPCRPEESLSPEEREELAALLFDLAGLRTLALAEGFAVYMGLPKSFGRALWYADRKLRGKRLPKRLKRSLEGEPNEEIEAFRRALALLEKARKQEVQGVQGEASCKEIPVMSVGDILLG